MPLTFHQVASQIRALARSSYAETLIGSLARSVRITLQEPGADLALGQSRFGGWPDVPQDFEWPTCIALSNPAWWKGYLEDKHGTDPGKYNGAAMQLFRSLKKPKYDKPKPLTLLAQFNLAELPNDWDLGLPRNGQLLFFCDMGDELVHGGSTEPHDRWRVIHFDTPPERFVEMPSPADSPDVRPEVRALRFVPEWTIDEGARRSKPDIDSDAFHKVRDMLIGNWGATQHRLLGHPQPIQRGIAHGAQMTLRQMGYKEHFSEGESAEAGRVWQSLLQLDGNDELGWSWGDGGRMHFSIRRADLQQLNFGEVMAELQCH